MTSPTTPQKSKPKLALLIGIAFIILITATLAIFGGPLFEVFKDPEKLKAIIANAGPWGPIVFMGLQLLQVFFAPIPGQVTGFLGGYLFGAAWGTIYTMLGSAIGFTLVFLLSRKLGRPFVEYFVDKKHLKKFDYITENNGVLILFLIFLLPAFPDDLICYIAGLTSIKIRTLVLISLLGRLPTAIVLSLAGSGASEGNASLVIIISVAMFIVFVLGFWQRKRLEQWVKRLSSKK